MTYAKNGRLAPKNEETKSNPTAVTATPADGEKKIKVDGFGQVLAMLQHADPEFRLSLLRRLMREDPRLATQLQNALRANES